MQNKEDFEGAPLIAQILQDGESPASGTQQTSTERLSSASRANGAAPLDHPNTQQLLAAGLTPEQVKDSSCFNYSGGLAFTYLDPSGKEYTFGEKKEPFFRHRPNWSEEKIAEADAELKTPSKYLSPKDCGCSKPFHSPLHVKDSRYKLRLKKVKYPIILTEGEKKTLKSSLEEVASGSKTITIGLGGVDAFSDKRTEVDEDGDRQLIPELRAEIEWEHRDVYIAFDSDLIEKPTVRHAVQALAIALHKIGARPWLIRLPQELPGTYQDPKNGLDDFIIRHGYSAFIKLLNSAAPINVSYTNKEGGGKDYLVKDLAAEPSQKSESHIKALMAWSIIKESIAVRQVVGAYRWEGTHWQEQKGKARDALSLQLETFYDSQRWLNRVGAVFNNAAAELERRLTVPQDRWAPSHLLAFTNLVLDTQTGKTLPHNPAALITSCLPYPYDPAAKCPKWENFLQEALGGDASLIQLAQAMIRWILTPKVKAEPFAIDKAFNCNGPRGSGKGTFVGTIRALVGSDNVGNGGPDVYGDKEKLARLVDKKLALDSDAKGFLPSSTNFNKVVSNEPVLIESKYKDSDDVPLGVVVLWASNEPIAVAKDGAEGTGRRLIPIPFNNQPTEVNIHLKKELLGELPGIFQWAWSMPEAEMFKVLSGPIKSKLALELAIDQQLTTNLPLWYLSEKLPDGCDWTKASALFEPFDVWRQAGKFMVVSITAFGKELNRIKGAESKRSNGIKWRLPVMRRWNEMEPSTAPNDSKYEAFYDYAEHLGIGSQSATTETSPDGSKRNTSDDGEGQPFQQPFQLENQSLTEESSSEKSNGIVGIVSSKKFSNQEDMGDTPLNRNSNATLPSTIPSPSSLEPPEIPPGASVTQYVEKAIECNPRIFSDADAIHEAIKSWPDASAVSLNQVKAALRKIKANAPLPLLDRAA